MRDKTRIRYFIDRISICEIRRTSRIHRFVSLLRFPYFYNTNVAASVNTAGSAGNHCTDVFGRSMRKIVFQKRWRSVKSIKIEHSTRVANYYFWSNTIFSCSRANFLTDRLGTVFVVATIRTRTFRIRRPRIRRTRLIIGFLPDSSETIYPLTKSVYIRTELWQF